MSLIWDYGFTPYDIEISKILEEIDNDLKSFLDKESCILLDIGSDRENTTVKYSDLRVSSQSKVFSNERIEEIKKWLERNKTDFLESDFTEYSNYLELMNEIILAPDFPKYKFNQSDKDAVINDTALFTLRDNLITDAVYSKDFRENEQFIELCIEFYGEEYYQKYIKPGTLGERDGNSDDLFMSISNSQDLADYVTTEEYKEYVRTVSEASPATCSYFFKNFREEFLSLPIKYVENEPAKEGLIKIKKAPFLRHHTIIAGLLESRDGYYIYEDSRWGFGNKLSWQNDKEAVLMEISALIRFKLEVLYRKCNEILSKFKNQYVHLGFRNEVVILSYLKRFYSDLIVSKSYHLEFLNAIELPQSINKKITSVVGKIIDYQMDILNGRIAEKMLVPSETKGISLDFLPTEDKIFRKKTKPNWPSCFSRKKIECPKDSKDFLNDFFSLLSSNISKNGMPLMTEKDIIYILKSNFSCYSEQDFPFNPIQKKIHATKGTLINFMYQFYEILTSKFPLNKERLAQFLLQNFNIYSYDSKNCEVKMRSLTKNIKVNHNMKAMKIDIPKEILLNENYAKFIRQQYRKL